MADNPSFAGVHPSLVSQLHEFDGHIAARIRDAYRGTDDGNVFSRCGTFAAERRGVQPQHDERERAAREMEVVRREAMARPTQEQQMHEQRQMQLQLHEQQIQMQQQQEQYQRQQFQEQQRMQDLEQVEQQRQLRKQQQQSAEARTLTHRQSQQFHEPHQQQPEEARTLTHRQSRQFHEPHQQQPGEARTLTHRQSQQFREPHQQQYSHPPAQPQYQQQFDQGHAAYAVADRQASTHATPPASQFPGRSLTHSQSLSSLHAAYAQDQVMQPPHRQSQPSLYTMHPDHRQSHESIPSDTSAMSHFPPAAYGVHIMPQQQQPQQTAVDPAYHYQETKYWPTTDQSSAAQSHVGHRYTPEGALRGIAADDYSLQETWQSYMYKVRCFYDHY